MKVILPLFFVAALLGAGCGSSVSTPRISEALDTPSVTPAVPQGETATTSVKYLTTYQDSSFGYSFIVPTGSFLQQEEPGGGRIQNYTGGRDFGGLEKGKYYLEFYAVRGPQRVIATVEQCHEEKGGALITYDNGYRAWVGLGPVGGDAGGVRYQLCAVSKETTIVMTVTTAVEDGPATANAIFQSFRPTPTSRSNGAATIVQ